MRQTTLDALNRLYAKLEELAGELYNQADDALEPRDFDDASLLQSQAAILYEQMENLDSVISEHEG